MSDGHRRAAAAKMVGQTIRAWISWTVDTDRLDCEGKPIKTGLTYELAKAMLDQALQQAAGEAPFPGPTRSASA